MAARMRFGAAGRDDSPPACESPRGAGVPHAMSKTVSVRQLVPTKRRAIIPHLPFLRIALYAVMHASYAFGPTPTAGTSCVQNAHRVAARGILLRQ